MNDDDKKRIQNLFKTLQKDSKIVFYASTKYNLLKKLQKSAYQKDRVFTEFYQKLRIKILIKTMTTYL